MHTLSVSLSLPPSLPSFHSLLFIPPVFLTFFRSLLVCFPNLVLLLIKSQIIFLSAKHFLKNLSSPSEQLSLMSLSSLHPHIFCYYTLLPSALFMHLRTSVAYQILCFWPWVLFFISSSLCKELWKSIL